ncbi:hypothetical protein Ciccas_001410 [Cichlidogyrus casuarinus]|uniref:Uncharacterized protein n=1 Tax=Cichlidogyrus casuarinus TaxID=1844966 RepID=A0ABD2QKM1_9PLAT
MPLNHAKSISPLCAMRATKVVSEPNLVSPSSTTDVYIFCCVCGKFDHLENNLCYSCSELKRCFSLEIIPKPCPGCDPQTNKCSYCCLMKMSQLQIIKMPLPNEVATSADAPLQTMTGTTTDSTINFLDPRKKARKRYQTCSSTAKNTEENIAQQHLSDHSSSSIDLSQASSSNFGSDMSYKPVSRVFPSIATLHPPNLIPTWDPLQFPVIQPSQGISYTLVKAGQLSWAQQMMVSFKFIPRQLTSKLIDYALPQLALLEFCKMNLSIVQLFVRNEVLLSQYLSSSDLKNDFVSIQSVESICRSKFFLKNEFEFIGKMLVLQPEAVGLGAKNDAGLIKIEADNLKHQLIQYLLIAQGNEGAQSLIHLIGILDLFRMITKIPPINLDYILKTVLK